LPLRVWRFFEKPKKLFSQQRVVNRVENLRVAVLAYEGG